MLSGFIMLLVLRLLNSELGIVRDCSGMKWDKVGNYGVRLIVKWLERMPPTRSAAII